MTRKMVSENILNDRGLNSPHVVSLFAKLGKITQVPHHSWCRSGPHHHHPGWSSSFDRPLSSSPEVHAGHPPDHSHLEPDQYQILW